jgi:hypothetical protein
LNDECVGRTDPVNNQQYVTFQDRDQGSSTN